jgi:hypothetical protein
MSKNVLKEEEYWHIIQDAWDRVRTSRQRYETLDTEMTHAAIMKPTMQVYCAIAAIYEQVGDDKQELAWYHKAVATEETLRQWQYRRIDILQQCLGVEEEHGE